MDSDKLSRGKLFKYSLELLKILRTDNRNYNDLGHLLSSGVERESSI